MEELLEIKAQYRGCKVSNVIFFAQVYKAFGTDVKASYRQIARSVGCTYENVRYHLERLEKSGLIAVEKISSYKRVYHLNKDAINRLA